MPGPSEHAHCSVGLVVHTTSATASLLPGAVASLRRAGVASSAIHAVLSNATQPAADGSMDGTHTHRRPRGFYEVSGLLWLCSQSRLLARHRSWLNLPASALAGPSFAETLAGLQQACRRGDAAETRPLCPTQSDGLGVYASADLARTACPSLQESLDGAALQTEAKLRKWSHTQASLTLSRLNASSRAPLASADRRWCWVNYIFRNVSVPLDDPHALLSVPMARAGRGPNSAASTAMRDQRRAAAKGLRNTTHARPGLRGLLDLLSHDDLVHMYKQGPRTFLYEFEGIDLYQRRAADMSF